MSKVNKYFCKLQYSQSIEQVLDGVILKKGEYVEVPESIYKKYKDSIVNVSTTSGITMEAYRMFFKVESVDIPERVKPNLRLPEEPKAEAGIEEGKSEEAKSEEVEAPKVEEKPKANRKLETN